MAHNTLAEIVAWHKKVRPTPDSTAFNVQLGCHFEEIAEMLESLAPRHYDGLDQRNEALWAVQELAENLKNGTLELVLVAGNRKDFLDSLADQIVTAVGVGYCADMDVPAACHAVSFSNFSKFDSYDNPIFDANGKVTKGPNYVEPDLGGLY
jgi:hypothetical protein